MQRLKWLAIACLILGLVPAKPILADHGAASTVLGRDFTLEAGQHLSDDLTVIGGQVQLEPNSVVEGNLTVFGGVATLEGEIMGDVVAVGGTLYLRDTAVVDGDLVVFGTVERSPGATVHGNIVEGLEAASRITSIEVPSSGLQVSEGSVSQANHGSGWLDGLGRRVGAFLLALMLAALVVILLPKQLGRTVAVMRTDWALSLGIGLLTYFVAGVLAIVFSILVLVCVGLPLLVVLAVALFYGATMGWTGAGRLIGQRVTPALHLSRTDTLTETLVGTGAITLVALVPCIGLLAAAAIMCWGLGATVLAHVEELQGLPGSPLRQTWTEPNDVATARPDTRPTGIPKTKDTRPLSRPEEPDPQA